MQFHRYWRIRLPQSLLIFFNDFILEKPKAPGSLDAMNSVIYIPKSARDAGAQLRFALARPLKQLPKSNFVGAWSSIAYLFPGLHPDGFEDAEGGWPRVLRPFAAEAWRSAEMGALDDDELYPCDAQWSGLYDRMHSHTTEEIERRRELAALSLACASV